MDITAMVIGVLLMLFSLVTGTTNFISAFLFKVFPFLSGVYVCFYSAVQMGWLNV